jgi:hypothetical protein
MRLEGSRRHRRPVWNTFPTGDGCLDVSWRRSRRLVPGGDLRQVRQEVPRLGRKVPDFLPALFLVGCSSLPVTRPEPGQGRSPGSQGRRVVLWQHPADRVASLMRQNTPAGRPEGFERHPRPLDMQVEALLGRGRRQSPLFCLGKGGWGRDWDCPKNSHTRTSSRHLDLRDEFSRRGREGGSVPCRRPGG